MQKLLVIAAACLVMVIASPLDIVQDSEGQHYYLVPVSREKRETDWDVQAPGRVVIKNQETLIDNDKHKLEATSYLSKNFADRREPVTTSGRVDYTHVETGNAFSILAENKRHQGTDYSLEGKVNLYKKGPLSVDVTGDYGTFNKHYDQPPQFERRPTFSTFLNGRLDF